MGGRPQCLAQSLRHRATGEARLGMEAPKRAYERAEPLGSGTGPPGPHLLGVRARFCMAQGRRQGEPAGSCQPGPCRPEDCGPLGGGTPSAGRPLAPQPSRKMLWDQAGGQRPWVLSQVWRRDARGRCLEEWGRMQKVCTWASGKRALQERPISSPSSPPSPTATFPSGSLAASIPSPTLFLQFLSGCFVCLGPPHGVWSSGPGIRSEPAAVAT